MQPIFRFEAPGRVAGLQLAVPIPKASATSA